MRHVLFILCVVMAWPALVGAQPRGKDGSERREKPESGQFHGRPSARDMENWLEFRREMEKFCIEHSPNRWRDINQSGDPRIDRGRFAGMAMRYGALKRLKDEDPEHYQLKVDQIKAEDTEYGLIDELQKKPSEADRIKRALRDNARRSIALSLKERQLRLAKLEKLIDKQKEQLSQDLQKPDPLVEARVEKMLNEGPKFFFSSPGPGGPMGGSRQPSTSGSVNTGPAPMTSPQ